MSKINCDLLIVNIENLIKNNNEDWSKRQTLNPNDNENWPKRQTLNPNVEQSSKSNLNQGAT